MIPVTVRSGEVWSAESGIPQQTIAQVRDQIQNLQSGWDYNLKTLSNVQLPDQKIEFMVPQLPVGRSLYDPVVRSLWEECKGQSYT